VPDYLIVDDFEGYDDREGSEVFSFWIDGLTDGLSGSLVGLYPNSVKGTFCETTIVHSGRQAMRWTTITPRPVLQRGVQTFAPVQNWTFGEVNTLVVYFRGDPQGLVESGGTITLSAAAWTSGTRRTSFRYAFKRLTATELNYRAGGPCHEYQRLGQSGGDDSGDLDAGSVHASVEVTPANSCSFQRRPTTGAASTSDNWAAAPIQAPYWVKITRRALCSMPKPRPTARSGPLGHGSDDPDGGRSLHRPGRDQSCRQRGLCG